MDKHSTYVWGKFVDPCPASEIFMIAHSAGGGCASSIIRKFHDTCVNRAKFIGFTDACHGSFDSSYRGDDLRWVRLSCMAYDASTLPLGKMLRGYNNFPTVSAGHAKHVYTTGCAWPMIRKSFLLRSQTLQARDDW